MRKFLERLLGLLADLPGQGPSALAGLERAIAAARHAHTAARRALAIAMAEEAREAERRAALTAKVSALEQRAVQALRAGREDLATQAAEAIAAMTADVDASKQASQRFAAEVALARREVDAQRRRLSDLDRGRRLARIGTALNAAAPASRSGVDSFAEAEAALAQVVADNQDARFVREEMAPPAEQLIERMADAGLGDPVQVRAADVLARLRSAAGLPVIPLLESTSNAQ
ncbi:PspA/IM30 family protein [Bradyrhizobium sp. ARR65]|uniref:PspA/IM30 family protein n=1 Tax=Bradyrhizobium sp. ARR65 TaxID=1040989 RepID=UPI0004643123|nr:PspA/IM30 family protein [Bradyrhizobium sp. ARR65]